MNPRLAAVYVLQQVFEQGRNLPDALESVHSRIPDQKGRALTQALSYGVLRHGFSLDAILLQLLKKPLKDKDTDLRCLLLIGLYQIIHMRVPDHAAVSETVKLTPALRKNWARAMVNGVLRNYLRQADSLLAEVEKEPVSRFDHPQWLLEKLQASWPNDWQAIAYANNQPAPMSLRVNRQQISREQYLERLQNASKPAELCRYSQDGLRLLDAVPVEQLPGFKKGLISVQDEAAQLAAPLLKAASGQRILDACAAPGGKTAHILEIWPALTQLDALEKIPARLDSVRDNLQRLQLKARLINGDATQTDAWWDGRRYDRILLDAPCSATGVIRRHPDIKYLRRADDLDALTSTQQQILQALWPLLASGGMLLYTTCSVLAEENNLQIESFLNQHDDAQLEPLELNWGNPTTAGQQILPGEENMDGFFYACLRKA
ncbi:16S rRNA (cytosine(967)-C(5))-methyltransferase [hydrothermal vent metagenome]|uniref:16S rRNA (cytosine(967)-C(5))-methyltransferase n=1 Tax=hydrothermal vent metagenome TaxID=652676 RepID=A0A3B1BQ35_9ZZZZ